MKGYSPKLFLLPLALAKNVVGFSHSAHSSRCENKMTMMISSEDMKTKQRSNAMDSISTRRQWYRQCSAVVASAAMTVFPMGATAAGKLVEYRGEFINEGASKSRQMDNSNVVFVQDQYYVTASSPPFIPQGDTSYPEKMPFVASQPRRDVLEKYRQRVQRGIDLLASLEGEIQKGDYKSILAAEAPEYSIRPLGLLAAGFMASDSTVPRQLYIARWYINEIYLDINDIKSAPSKEAALASHANAIKALNSVLGMVNRSITSKVGDPFVLL